MKKKVKEVLSDPMEVAQIAGGGLVRNLVAQRRSEGIVKDGLYFPETKRYILKKARFGLADFRLFDTDQTLVANSHHPGKNPLDSIDPLGVLGTGDVLSPFGEWHSICDVTSYTDGMTGTKIRPKTLSIHGRQLVKKIRCGSVVMNVAKMPRSKSMSVRQALEICRGESKDDRVYTVYADLAGRSMSFVNDRNELVAIMAKTTKALILDATLGAGSENSIDIAPGVDCSAIIAAVFGILQTGQHLMKDSLKNFVAGPMKAAAVDEAKNGVGAAIEKPEAAVGDPDAALEGAGESIAEHGEDVVKAGAGFGQLFMEIFNGL